MGHINKNGIMVYRPGEKVLSTVYFAETRKLIAEIEFYKGRRRPVRISIRRK